MIVVYSEERSRFEAISSYHERDIPKAERWRWDATARRWYANDDDHARRLAQYATGTAAQRLNALSPAEQQALADSMAQDAPADLVIPAPAGLAYLPYQRAGIFYMLRKFGDLDGFLAHTHNANGNREKANAEGRLPENGEPTGGLGRQSGEGSLAARAREGGGHVAPQNDERGVARQGLGGNQGSYAQAGGSREASGGNGRAAGELQRREWARSGSDSPAMGRTSAADGFLSGIPNLDQGTRHGTQAPGRIQGGPWQPDHESGGGIGRPEPQATRAASTGSQENRGSGGAGLDSGTHSSRVGGGVLLADMMGLGKTIQVIGAANAICERKGMSRALIIVPASLRLNWQQEWRKWHTGPLRPALLDVWPGGLFDHTAGKALIVSYDSILKWHPMIADVEWDLLCLDEAHLIKDERARRTKSIMGGKYKRLTFAPIQAKRRVYLTGTAIVNSAADLWPLVKSLAPTTLGSNHRDFTERYTAGGMLGELHTRLRTQIMIRRKKDDVLRDLPAKRRQIVLLDVPDAEGFVAAEQAAVERARAVLEQSRREMAGLPHGEQVMRLRQCRAIAMTEMSRIRKESALKKLPQAIEHIHDILGNVDRLVVFAHHHDVLDGLVSAFGRIAVGFDGRADLAKRQEAVDRFQHDRGARLFLGGLHAAGLGITLTAASTVVFVEMDWTPARMTQAEDRLHRIGQHSPVLVQHLVVDGSIDSKMAKIILGKQAIMDAALDGGSPADRQRDILDEVMAA